MNSELYYLETESNDPFYNLAFEEYVLEHRTEGDYLILWQNDNTVVIGQNQIAEAEVNIKFAERHNVKIARRKTGGGAVYHDLGNLNYSFITDSGDTRELSFEKFTGAVVSALRRLGLDAEASGRNDILVNGDKVSGTAQRLSGGRLLFHGTLLFDSDTDMISGALNAAAEKFKGKSSKSVKSRVGSIKASLPSTTSSRKMSVADFWNYLKGAFSKEGALEETALSGQELAEVERLRDIYASWEWNFGKPLPYEIDTKNRFSGGTLGVRMSIEHGFIKQVRFYGDFLSLRPLTPVESRLEGIKFRKNDIERALDDFEVTEFFGSITKDEIVKTIVYAGSPEEDRDGCVVTLSANAGVSIMIDDFKILVDALHDEKTVDYSAVTEEIFSRMIKSEAFTSPDALVFTHKHRDHYSPGMTERFARLFPACRIIMPEKKIEMSPAGFEVEQIALQMPESETGRSTFEVPENVSKNGEREKETAAGKETTLINLMMQRDERNKDDDRDGEANSEIVANGPERIELISGREYRTYISGAQIDFFRLPHAGEEYQNVVNYGMVINKNMRNILILGDACVSGDDVGGIVSGRHIDVALLNFPWITLASGRKYVTEIIKPDHLLIYHLPFEGDDLGGFRAATSVAAAQLRESGLDVRVLSDALQSEKISFA